MQCVSPRPILVVWNAIAAGRGHAKGEQFDAFSSSSVVWRRCPGPLEIN